MGFTFNEIKNLIRFKVRDNDAVKYSEYELKLAVNEVIRYLSNALSAINADFLEKTYDYSEAQLNSRDALAFEEEYRRTYNLAEDAPAPKMPDYMRHSFKYKGEPLPDDYAMLVGVAQMMPPEGGMLTPCDGSKYPREDEYKIVGNRIYAGTPCFRLHYRSTIPEVKDDYDVVELPVTLKDAFAKLSALVLENANTDVVMAEVTEAAHMLVPRRRYRNAHIRMPFLC